MTPEERANCLAYGEIQNHVREWGRSERGIDCQIIADLIENSLRDYGDERERTARDEEREACAKICDKQERYQWGCEGKHYGFGTPDCPIGLHHHHDDRCAHPLDKAAAAIRARGKE